MFFRTWAWMENYIRSIRTTFFAVSFTCLEKPGVWFFHGFFGSITINHASALICLVNLASYWSRVYGIFIDSRSNLFGPFWPFVFSTTCDRSIFYLMLFLGSSYRIKNLVNFLRHFPQLNEISVTEFIERLHYKFLTCILILNIVISRLWKCR